MKFQFILEDGSEGTMTIKSDICNEASVDILINMQCGHTPHVITLDRDELIRAIESLKAAC